MKVLCLIFLISIIANIIAYDIKQLHYLSLNNLNESLDYYYSFNLNEVNIQKTKETILNFNSVLKLRKLNENDFIISFTDYELNTFNEIENNLKKPFHFQILNNEIQKPIFDFHFNKTLNKILENLYINLLEKFQLPIRQIIETKKFSDFQYNNSFNECPNIFNLQFENELYKINSYSQCLNSQSSFMFNFLISKKSNCDYLVSNFNLINAKCYQTNKIKFLEFEQKIKSKLNFIKKLPIIDISLTPKINYSDKIFNYNVTQVKKILKKICLSSISPKLTELLIDLDNELKNMNDEQFIVIENFLDKDEDCTQQVKDIFHSLVFQQNNHASLKYLLNKESNDYLYSLLPFYKKTSKEVVDLISIKLEKQLIKQDFTYRSLLGLTAYLGNYCDDNSDCYNDENIIKIQNLIVHKLGFNCSINKNKLLFIKSLQNLGFSKKIENQLINCLNTNNTTPERSAIIEILLKSSNPIVINNLKKILFNQNESNEIRIKIFLFYIQNHYEKEFIENFLNSLSQIEKNVQILSFLNFYSSAHNDLKNLNNFNNFFAIKNEKNVSLSNYIQFTSNLIKNNFLDGNFGISIIRNNNEKITDLNLKSKLKITDKFKLDIEINFNQIGLDKLIEKFIDNLNENSNSFKNNFNSFFSFINTLKNFKIIDLMDENLINKHNLVFDLKINKKTIFLIDYQKKDNSDLFLKRMKRKIDENNLNFNFEKIVPIIYLKKGYELSNSVSAIKLELTGVLVIGLKYNNRSFEPTFINDLSTSLMINSNDKYQIYSNVYLNPVFKYEIQPVDNSYLFKLFIDEKKFSLVKTSFYIGYQNDFEKMLKQSVVISKCTENFSKLLGIEFCTNFYKNVRMTEKIYVFELSIEKTDFAIKNWEFILSYKEQFNKFKKNQLIIHFDTPGSEINRSFNTIFDLKRNNYIFNFAGVFNNSMMNYNLNLNLSQKNNFDEVEGSFILLEENKIKLIINYVQKKHSSKTKSEYVPNFRMIIPSLKEPYLHFTGSIVYDVKNKESLRFTFYNKKTNQRHLKGLVKKISPEKLFTDLSFNMTDILNLNFVNYLHLKKEKFFSSESQVTYSYLNQKPRTAKLSSKFTNTSLHSIIGFNTFVSLKLSRNAKYNFDFAYNFTYRPSSFLENQLRFNYLNIKEIYLFQQYSFSKSSKLNQSFSLNNFMKINLLPQELTYQNQFNLIHQPTKELFIYKIYFNFDKIYQNLAMDLLEFSFNYDQTSIEPLKKSLTTSLKLKDKINFIYTDQLEVVNKNEFKGLIALSWFKTKYVRLNYFYVINNDIFNSGKNYKLDFDIETHMFKNPLNHKAFLSYQKSKINLTSILKTKDLNFWNLSMKYESKKFLNFSLNSQYLTIKKNIKFSVDDIKGYLAISTSKFFFVGHNTYFVYNNLKNFQLTSSTVKLKPIEKTLLNLTIIQNDIQHKFNLNGDSIGIIELLCENNGQSISGDLEMKNYYFKKKSKWTYFNGLMFHLKTKLFEKNITYGNLIFFSQNDFTDYDLKANYYRWNLVGNAKFKNEGRKLINFDIKRVNEIGNIDYYHKTNLSLAVTNLFVNSTTYNKTVKEMYLNGKILGIDTSEVNFFFNENFEASLVFNPFIRNKFVTLKVNQIPNENNSWFFITKYENYPKLFQFETNLMNKKLMISKAEKDITIKTFFDNLKYLGKCKYDLEVKPDYFIVNFEKFNLETNNSTFHSFLNYSTKSKFNLKFFKSSLISLITNLDLKEKIFLLNFKKNDVKEKSFYFNISPEELLLLHENQETNKKLEFNLNSKKNEAKFLKIFYLKNDYLHETELFFTNLYLFNGKIITKNKYSTTFNFDLWNKIDFNYEKNNSYTLLKFLKNKVFLFEVKKNNSLSKFSFINDENSQKQIILFINSKVAKNNLQIIYMKPNNTNILEISNDYYKLDGENFLKLYDFNVEISKIHESKMFIKYKQNNLTLIVDPFIAKKLILTMFYVKDKTFKSSTEFLYLGHQTYQLFSNLTVNENKVPFKLSIISNRKTATNFSLIKDDWKFYGEFNFFKINKKTGVILIENKQRNYYGNITLEANKSTFLIATYKLMNNKNFILGEGDLIITMSSFEVFKLNYKDEVKKISSKILWLGDKFILSSELNKTDINHKILAEISYEPKKKFSLNFNKTQNFDKTFDAELFLSREKTSYLSLHQNNKFKLSFVLNYFNSINKTAELIFKNIKDSTQKIKFSGFQTNNLAKFLLYLNLNKIHPVFLLNTSLISQDININNQKNKEIFFIFNLLEKTFASDIRFLTIINEDGFSLESKSESKYLSHKSDSSLSFYGLKNKNYTISSDIKVNQLHVKQHYTNKKLLKFILEKPNRNYLLNFSNKDSSFESIFEKTIDGKTISLFSNLNKTKNIDLTVGLKNKERKSSLNLIKIKNSNEYALKAKLVFENINTLSKENNSYFNLVLEKIKTEDVVSKKLLIDSSYILKPLFVELKKNQKNYNINWCLADKLPINNLTLNYNQIQNTEYLRLVNLLLFFNNFEISRLNLEKVFNEYDLTKFYFKFLNTSVKYEDETEKFLLNINNGLFYVKINKNQFMQIQIIKDFKNFKKTFISHLDFRNYAIGYESKNFSLNDLEINRFYIKLIPLLYPYISINNTKENNLNEVFLFKITSENNQKRKVIYKQNNLYSFLKSAWQRHTTFTEKRLNFDNFLQEKFLNNLALEKYIGSFKILGQKLKEELKITFDPIFKNWSFFGINDSNIYNFLNQLNLKLKNISIKIRQKIKEKLNEYSNDLEYYTSFFNELSESLLDLVLSIIENIKYRVRKTIRIISNYKNSFLLKIKDNLPDEVYDFIAKFFTVYTSKDFLVSKFLSFDQNFISFYF